MDIVYFYGRYGPGEAMSLKMLIVTIVIYQIYTSRELETLLIPCIGQYDLFQNSPKSSKGNFSLKGSHFEFYNLVWNYLFAMNIHTSEYA